MRSLFLEPRVYIIGLCKANSWVRWESARGQGQLCSLMWWASGAYGCQSKGALVVRPASPISLDPSLKRSGG